MEDWLTKKDQEVFSGCFLERLDSSPHGPHTLVEQTGFFTACSSQGSKRVRVETGKPL